jgi:hypothetical protein
MRCLKFEEAAVSVDRAIQLMEETKSDFGEDLNIVGAKFYNLKATLSFVLENWQAAVDATNTGLGMLIAVKAAE